MSHYIVFLVEYHSGQTPHVKIEADQVECRGDGALRFSNGADNANETIALFPDGRWMYYRKIQESESESSSEPAS